MTVRTDSDSKNSFMLNSVLLVSSKLKLLSWICDIPDVEVVGSSIGVIGLMLPATLLLFLSCTIMPKSEKVYGIACGVSAYLNGLLLNSKLFPACCDYYRSCFCWVTADRFSGMVDAPLWTFSALQNTKDPLLSGNTIWLTSKKPCLKSIPGDWSTWLSMFC